MLPKFALERPDTLAAALELVGEDAVPYCGGTELLMAMKMNVLRPDCLVDLKGVRALRHLEWQSDRLVLGGAITHAMLARDRELLARTRLLCEVEQRVGNARVRAQGSIGGNLCFAEPRSDVTTLLVALRATVVLASASRSRELSVLDFLVGAYETVREPGELLLEVAIPAATRQQGVYIKHQYSERPSVAVALVHDSERGTWRLSIGAVADLPLVVEVPSLSDLSPGELAEAVDPVEDLAGSIEYKRHLVEVYVRRAIALSARGDYA